MFYFSIQRLLNEEKKIRLGAIIENSDNKH